MILNLNDDPQPPPQQQQQQLGNKMKEILRDERLKYLKQKREQEQLKRKEELEESLKRKNELRERQLKERQKKIDEFKLVEAEKRTAVIERKKLNEEKVQVSLSLYKNKRISTVFIKGSFCRVN